MIYLILFLEFFKIGLFTFGGGYAMIPLVREVVLEYSWISEDKFYDFIGLCEATPGPIALNMATYIGNSQGGVLGGVIASLGVVLPSFIIILIVASILKKFNKNKVVQGILGGIKPVVIGLILSAGIALLLKNLAISYDASAFSGFDFISLAIFLTIAGIYLVFKLLFKKKLNPIILISISAILGVVICLIVL